MTATGVTTTAVPGHRDPAEGQVGLEVERGREVRHPDRTLEQVTRGADVVAPDRIGETPAAEHGGTSSRAAPRSPASGWPRVLRDALVDDDDTPLLGEALPAPRPTR